MAAKARGAGFGWGLMTFFSVGVGLYGIAYLLRGVAGLPPSVIDNTTFWKPLLIVHAASAGVALLIGAFQFLRSIRVQRPNVHRWIGRAYVTACIIGGLSGGVVALTSAAGTLAQVGFLALAVLWLLMTWAGWQAALRRDFIKHERWMIRSFALTLAAVTLRLYLIPVGVFAWDFVSSYALIAWLCWVPNIVIAEAWLRLRDLRARPAAA